MLEAAFDGDVPGIKEILSEVSPLANTNLVTWPSQPLSSTHGNSISLCASFVVVRPQKAVAVSKYIMVLRVS